MNTGKKILLRAACLALCLMLAWPCIPYSAGAQAATLDDLLHATAKQQAVILNAIRSAINSAKMKQYLGAVLKNPDGFFLAVLQRIKISDSATDIKKAAMAALESGSDSWPTGNTGIISITKGGGGKLNITIVGSDISGPATEAKAGTNNNQTDDTTTKLTDICKHPSSSMSVKFEGNLCEVTHKCDECGTTLESYIGKWEIKKTQAATCRTPGYTNYLITYQDRRTPDKIQKTNNGYTESYTEIIPIDPNAHVPAEKPSYENVTESVCTVGGSYDRVTRCKLCNTVISSKHITTNAMGHTYEAIDDAIEPTCESEGRTAGKKCSVCGTVFENQTTVKKLGHRWGAWQVTTHATVDAEGEETRICQNDSSHKQTRPIPKLTPAPTIPPTPDPTVPPTPEPTVPPTPDPTVPPTPDPTVPPTPDPTVPPTPDPTGTPEPSPTPHVHTVSQTKHENVVAGNCKAEGSYDEVEYCACGEVISRTHVNTGKDANNHTGGEKTVYIETKDVATYKVICLGCGVTLRTGTMPYADVPEDAEWEVDAVVPQN